MIKMSRPLFTMTLVVLITTLLGFCREVAATYRYHSCSASATFSANTTYESNLSQLLSSLSSNATTENGFYNTTVGQNAPDIAYGLFLCRGDVSTTDCQDCLVTAAKDVVEQYCPTQKGAVIWYDDCMLRYANRSFFSTMVTDPGVSMFNSQNISEPDRCDQLVTTTFNELVSHAANGTADAGSKKFATKEASFTSSQRLYTLGQCTPDITSDDCSKCIREAIQTLPECCNGKQGGRVLFPSCNIRYEIYAFYRLSNASTPTPPPPPGKSKISSLTIILISTSIAVFLAVLALVYCFLTRRARKKYLTIQNQNAANEVSNVESLQFDLSKIEAATNNFSDDNLLGAGGFGEVYKGELLNGQEIAVKRLSKSSSQGAEEFKNEVVLLAKLQHRNLVRLLGFCLEGTEKILVYEFVRNKSLDYFLFEPEKQRLLDWSRRYKIIGGIARGMIYLHEDSRLRIIHRDLKTSNILLDDDMNAKISDFGMARIFGVDQTQANTNKIVGTFGYMSPEYAMHGEFSMKSDVYSFGVLVLEILTGRKNSSFRESSNEEDLTSYAWKNWRDGTPLEILDPTLRDSYSRNEVLRCIQIGLLCVQENPADRLTMGSIVLMLNSNSATFPSPQQPALFLHSRTGSRSNRPIMESESESDQSKTKSMPWSVNEASITELEPR